MNIEIKNGWLHIGPPTTKTAKAFELEGIRTNNGLTQFMLHLRDQDGLNPDQIFEILNFVGISPDFYQ